jgi:hypothetical protein
VLVELAVVVVDPLVDPPPPPQVSGYVPDGSDPAVVTHP